MGRNRAFFWRAFLAKAVWPGLFSNFAIELIVLLIDLPDAYSLVEALPAPRELPVDKCVYNKVCTVSARRGA
jgi:hypothetical protein